MVFWCNFSSQNRRKVPYLRLRRGCTGPRVRLRPRPWGSPGFCLLCLPGLPGGPCFGFVFFWSFFVSAFVSSDVFIGVVVWSAGFLFVDGVGEFAVVFVFNGVFGRIFPGFFWVVVGLFMSLFVTLGVVVYSGRDSWFVVEWSVGGSTFYVFAGVL